MQLKFSKDQIYTFTKLQGTNAFKHDINNNAKYITNDYAVDKGRRLSPVLFYAIAKTHENNKNCMS